MNLNNLNAYEVIMQRQIDDIHSEGAMLKHKKSGARVLLLSNDDDNKVFNIAFRTPVSTSTGVPHILEHSVLCGSEKYPAKDPFVELVKGSLNTFLNAMTFPDKTMYPVASCNDKDFQNLMDVYMDSVLHPNIYKHEEIFRQEGWSYELESKDDELVYNGVVYNEMKGVFSSPDGVLDRMILTSLFPDTTYFYESGGDPAVIPELTYEDFLAFHSKYYHPSNSYIYLYGDMDMCEKLEWLDKEYLSKYDVKEVDSAIGHQEAFEKMRDVVGNYSIASNESLEENTYLSYNKVVGTSLDAKLCLAFDILDYALLSAPGAPIKKALLDAGVGTDISGSYDCGSFQPIFSVVARGSELEKKEQFVSIIEDTLRDIVDKGVDAKALTAGINISEFRFREADFGGYPKGLIHSMNLMDSWLYDDDKPFIHLEQLALYQELREEIGTGYFEQLVKEYLLENQHGSLVTLVPEQGRSARMDEELREKLQEYKASLSDEEVQELVRRTRALKEYQDEPSSQEDIEKIPLLSREDISTEISPIYNEEIDLDGTKVVFHEVETNGIGYLDLIFGADDIAEEDVPYLGILQTVLGIIDTENYTYGELANETNARTGGMSTGLELYTDVRPGKESEYHVTFEVKTKALYEQIPFALEMMNEVMFTSKLGDTKRILELLKMTQLRMQNRFVSSGHSAATLRAMSYGSSASHFKDMTAGVEYYQTISALIDQFEEKKEELSVTLTRLCEQLFRKNNMMLSYTASREGLSKLEEGLPVVKEALYDEKEYALRPFVACTKKNEGFRTASKVQYVARTGNFIKAGYKYHGALQILKVIMSFDYLWMNLRVKGGAYGCMNGFNRLGDAYFVSYRDPHLKKTLETYDGIPEYVRNFSVSERDMTKYIIGTISNIDQPMSPAGKGDRSMNLYMNHVTEEMIQKERMQILNATPEDIRSLAPITQAVLDCDQICVIGGEAKIEDAKDIFGTVTDLA